MRLTLLPPLHESNRWRALHIRSDDNRDYAAFDWHDEAPIRDSWYYRAVGRSGAHLIEIEIADGLLRSVDFLVGRATPDLFDVARSMSRVELDAHPRLAL